MTESSTAKTLLLTKDFIEAAKVLGCEPAAVEAVCKVEAPRGGFNPDGSLVTLFEGHQFYKYTKGKYASTNPSICYPTWTTKFYGKTWIQEKVRLETALALDKTAALMSASFGKFQIMGFNFSLCEFTNVNDFVEFLSVSEHNQLEAFCKYVIHVRLDDELRDKRWDAFARGYNGPEYQKNNYATKLARAYVASLKNYAV